MKARAGRTQRFAAVLVVIAALTTSGVAATGHAISSEIPIDRTDPQPSIDADDVLLRVDLHANGTANWHVEHRIRLDDENVTEAFEQLEADIEQNGSAYRDRFASRMRDTVATAENATDREMTAREFAVTTDRRQLPQEYGVVVYTFEWDGFAQSTDGQIRAGDALAGLFLDSETTLLIAWPQGYEPASVSPEPTQTREHAVVWTGPLNFAMGQPSVMLDAVEPTTTASTTTAANVTTTETSTTGRESGDGLPMSLLVGTAMLAFAVAGAAFVVSRRDGMPLPWTTDGAEQLMSNEERVLDVLTEHDGRVKQQALVEELDWTEAKTSRVIRALKEDERVEVFRLGRENVVSLSDDEDDT